MEQVYDPAASKSSFQNIQDVQPGLEDMVISNKGSGERW
jgi:hypothetical protein